MQAICVSTRYTHVLLLPPTFCLIPWLIPDGITLFFAYSDSTHWNLSGDMNYMGGEHVQVQDLTMFSSSPPMFRRVSRVIHHGITSFFAYSESTRWELSSDIYFVGYRRIPVKGTLTPPHLLLDFSTYTQRNHFILCIFGLYSSRPI